jgi:TRAP-type C4-dicarboxylate transport system permease small subunit
MQTRARRITGVLIAVNMVVAGLALVAMLLHVVADIVMREFFDAPFSGTLEIVSYWYMIGLVFLAIPAAQAHGEHVRVELFTSGISPRVKAGIDICVLLASAAILILFTSVTFGEAMRQTARNAMVEAGTGTILVWPTRWLVPLSMASTSLICIVQAIGLAVSRAKRETPSSIVHGRSDV